MRTLALVFLALACSSSLPGASAEDTPGDSHALEEDFSLELGEVARLEDADLAFRFESVITDSRCPPNVTCIWAGEVTVEIRWMRPEDPEGVLLSLSPRDKPSRNSRGDWTVQLLEVLPYPGSSKGSETETTRATFRFESTVHSDSGVSNSTGAP